MDFQSIALPTELSGQMQYVYHMGNTTIEFFELQVKFEKVKIRNENAKAG